VVIRALINCMDNVLVVPRFSTFGIQAENVVRFIAEMVAVFSAENDNKILSHYILEYLVEVTVSSFSYSKTPCFENRNSLRTTACARTLYATGFARFCTKLLVR
jgi:hypothetical protein